MTLPSCRSLSAMCWRLARRTPVKSSIPWWIVQMWILWWTPVTRGTKGNWSSGWCMKWLDVKSLCNTSGFSLWSPILRQVSSSALSSRICPVLAVTIYRWVYIRKSCSQSTMFILSLWTMVETVLRATMSFPPSAISSTNGTRRTLARKSGPW